ncbi:hypothetical protein GKE82_24020 [Conexibacter sp. W3-3-2]|uniref:hypothetical protein n=1 Tax=Conexibacter sp. W3-3-2 TaxID=2675227 RepID=UPI0012B7B26C|nr:hypothetical protein [Conexibacter sp. W3-3-2]MTD47275.1 hypothetical protein [Conexibacter sp. W3-3-2]
MRHRRSLIPLLPLLVAGLLSPSAAQAGTYEARYCGPTNPTVGEWASSWGGSPYTYVGNNCNNGGYMSSSFDPAVPHAEGTFAQWRLAAAADTKIVRVESYRDWRANSNQAFGDAHTIIHSDARGRIDGCTALMGCSGVTGSAAWDTGESDWVSFLTHCTGANGCPAGVVENNQRDIRVTLSDDIAPTVTGTNGTLMSATTSARNRSLTFSATDRGGGIYGVRFVIDGQELGSLLDIGGGGTCAPSSTRRVPCPLSHTASATLDTATVPDGDHTAAIKVFDITRTNGTISGAWPIRVDNLPPTQGEPTIAGTPRVGDTLTCTANAVNGQAPTSIAYSWQIANADGSRLSTLAPASSSAQLTVPETATGKKIICVAHATDGGGTSRASSSMTAGPFADGATVRPYCDGRPTAATDPCGDADGDRIPNREDEDDDNDGTPDASDPAPTDASVPAKNSNPAGTTTTGPGSTSSGPSSSGQPPTTGATSGLVLQIKGSRTRSVRFGRRIATVATLTAEDKPLADAVVRIYDQAIIPARLTVRAGAPEREIGRAVTDSAGRMRFLIPTGVSRDVIFRYAAQIDGKAVTGTSRLRLLVRAKLTDRPNRSTLRNGQSVTFTGSMHGGRQPNNGTRVLLQARRGNTWVTAASGRTTSNGRYRLRYRFTRTTRARSYQMRVVSRPTSNAPYLAGASKIRTIKVTR